MQLLNASKTRLEQQKPMFKASSIGVFGIHKMLMVGQNSFVIPNKNFQGQLKCTCT